MKTIKRVINGKEYKIEKGLAKSVKEADNGTGTYSPSYIQINLDISEGLIWGDYHYSVGHNSWSEYHDPNIINLGYYSDKHFKISNIHQRLIEAVYDRETLQNPDWWERDIKAEKESELTYIMVKIAI